MKVCQNDLELCISYQCRGHIIAIVNQRWESQKKTLGYYINGWANTHKLFSFTRPTYDILEWLYAYCEFILYLGAIEFPEMA